VKTLLAHQEVLTALDDKAHRVGAQFTDTEKRNAAKLRVVRCSSDT
jgi:Protein of unknown function (DUF2563)